MFGFLVLILPATRVIGNFHWPLFREPGKLLKFRSRVVHFEGVPLGH
jgi:hypothetical protein